MFSRRRLFALMVVASSFALLLAGCHPTEPSPTKTPHAVGSSSTSASAIPTKSANATPTAVAAPVQTNIADYLLDGTPYVADADGEWSGHYGFFTDASKSVSCDLYIFSGDSGGVSCGITPGHLAQRTYALPAGIPVSCSSDPASSYMLDGTAISISYKEFGSATSDANVGFAGCLSDYDSSEDVARKVLPPNTILTVTQQGFETYTCAVTGGVASCRDSAPGSSFVFGLSTVTFHQG